MTIIARHRYLLLYGLIGLLVSICYNGFSQCGLSGNFVFTDTNNGNADTFYKQIVVSDLKNPFLNSGSQGVCGVGLDFRSAFIGDAIIDLFSPSGQSVRLVGGTPTSYLTPNVRWDVFFVPQSSMANPDIGFNDIWENDQNWANFVIYRGEYYPHLGRLEDFSLGSANGVWTLRIIDLEDFGDITLLEATIFFCDEEGLSCSECITDAGQILANPISACQNRAGISIDLNKTFEVGQDTSLYYYSNIVTKADTVITYIEDIDVLTDLDAGVYRICGIQILEQDTNLLPSVGSFVVADAFEAAILESSSCGIIGDQCVALTVFEIPDTTRINATICKGDIYTVGNEDFEESGQYLVTLQGSQCDSLVFLSLTVLDFNVDIIASSRELSCSESTIQLGVDLASQSLDSVFYIWRDDLGEIIMPSNQPEITISKEGQYVLETVLCTNGYCCTVYDTISVVQSSDFPILTLTADTLTCTRDTVTIGITSSDVIGQVVWTNAAGDVLTPKSDASVDVQIGGVYTVIATHTNGCIVQDQITIRQDTAAPQMIFVSDTLFCTTDSIQILNTNSNPSFEYSWQGVMLGSEQISSPWVNTDGEKRVEVVNPANGCTQQVIVPVIAFNQPLQIDVSIGAITCIDSIVRPQVTSASTLSTVRWTLGQSTVMGVRPILRQAGVYNVYFEDIYGCTLDTLIALELDTIALPISLEADQLTCAEDSVRIRILGDTAQIVSFQWSGPFMFVSDSLSPFVHEDGEYALSYISATNGCSGVVSIQITNDATLPIFLFEAEPITCVQDTTLIIINPAEQNYTYQWDGPIISNNTNQNQSVVTPGLYTVTVTDANGCYHSEEINILDERDDYTISLVNDTLNCARLEIEVTHPIDLLSVITVTGPNGYLTNTFQHTIENGGDYIAQYTTLKGCEGMDTFSIIVADEVPMVFLSDIDTITCRQPSVQITASADNSNIQFTWFNDQNEAIGSGSTISIQQGGMYSVTGTAANQCRRSVIFEVPLDTAKQAITLEKDTDITCIKDTVILSLVAPLNIDNVLWPSSGAMTKTIPVTRADWYEIRIIGANGCISIDSIEVKDIRVFPSAVATVDTLNCALDTVTLKLTPSLVNSNIIWESTNPQLLPDGVFQHIITIPGSYAYTLLSTEGCETKGKVDVIEDVRIPQFTSINADTLDCFNESVPLSVRSNLPLRSMRILGPNTDTFLTTFTLDVDTAGLYSIEVTATNHCTNQATYVVNVNQNAPIFDTFTDTITCDEGRVTIGVVSSIDLIDFLWQGENFAAKGQNIVVLKEGAYTVTVTASNGCTASKTVDVAIDTTKVSFSIQDTFFIPCDSVPTTLNILDFNPSYSIKWFYPDGSFRTEITPTTILAGLYHVEIIGANGCTSELKEFNVVQSTLPPQFSLLLDTLTCAKRNIDISASSNDTTAMYQWIKPGDLQEFGAKISINEGGNYSIIATNQFNCRDTVTFEIEVDTVSPQAIISQIGSWQCLVQEVTLNADIVDPSAHYQYAWRNPLNQSLGLQSVNILARELGLYSFDIINIENGCSKTVTFNVVPDNQSLNTVEYSVMEPSCPGINDGRIIIDSINGLSPYRTFINGIENANGLVFLRLNPDVYALQVIDDAGCVFTFDVEVPEAIPPLIDVEDDYLLNFGDSIRIQPLFFPDNMPDAQTIWLNGLDTVCVQCDMLDIMAYVNQVIQITYALSPGCYTTKTIQISVNKQLKERIPNIFRPASNQGNAYFYMPSSPGVKSIIKMAIFDKWAENVYLAENIVPGMPEQGWDGTFNGEEVEEGVYVLIMEIELDTGEIYRHVGDVTLLR